jgi:DNA polymerase-3 subunit gamma/tau
MPSLSRTYRPQTFAEITGQDQIKETLRLEAQTGKIGHAYLFAGPRGVGKTTLARIFAKTLNCLDRKNGEPCNACAACLDFGANKSLDFIEMDAASNTGVDNVREAIVEHVRFAPHAHKYKVYVLDEAHMLSTSAWNALLKTIEEPPAYAVFIFVTTELHKVPQTIQSRCQRFDFKRVPNDELAVKLARIAKEEGADVAPEVITSIIARSDGSVRDAESLLGQLLSLGEKQITAEIASLVLPISRLPLAAEILATWSKRELGPALKIADNLEEQGIPLLPLFDDLIQAIRLLLLAADLPDWDQKLKIGDDGEKALSKIVGIYPSAELSDMALMLMERRRDAKQGADVRFCLELASTAVALGMLPNSPKGPATQTTDRHNDTDDRSPPPNQNDQPKAEEPKTNSIPPTEVDEPPVAQTVTSAPSSSTGAQITLGQAMGRWPAVIKLLDEKSPSLTFVLKISHPVAIDGNTMTVRFQYPFHKEKILGDLKNRRIVEECVRQALGAPDLKLDGIIGEAPASVGEAKRDTVASLLKTFGGNLVEKTGTP